MKGSLIIVTFFAAGVLAGFYGWIPTGITEGSGLSLYALGALMFFVGVSVGSDTKTLKSFRSLNPRIMLLPVVTITGTLAGTALVSLLLKHRTLTECLAVGSGFGYYSLSGIFITQYKGAELGTVALLSNIARELVTLLAAPLIVRYFGKLALISSGGATTMDTTLPVILRYSGQNMLIVSIYHGFLVDFSVPWLVVLFCSL
jgi:uncharacterized membrane protein YbjE (DUF340 family)